ncbi:MAG: hypothetical protein ACFCD0_05125 [Gemmataceae bacterium]
MASAASLKIKCPSCEESVRLKDESLLGKKIRCPLCKYAFEVPASLNGSGSAKTKAQKGASEGAIKEKSLKSKGKSKSLDEDLLDDLDDLEETLPKKKKKSSKSKDAADKADSDEKDEKKSKKSKSKKKKGMSDDSKRLVMLIGVGALALVVLGIAGFFLMSGSGNDTNQKRYTGQTGSSNQPGTPGSEDPDNQDPNQPGTSTPPVVDPGNNTTPSQPRGYQEVNEKEFTQLVPNDTEHVAYTRVGAIANTPPGYLLVASFGDNDQQILNGLGFTLDSIDAFLHATRYQGTPWTWNVVHSKYKFDEKLLQLAFGLVEVEEPIKQRTYFRMKAKVNPLVSQLRHVTLANRGTGALAQRTDPLYVHLLDDKQTLIIADLVPLQQFLTNDAKFERLNDPDVVAPLPVPKKKPGKKPGSGPGPVNPGPGGPGPMPPGLSDGAGPSGPSSGVPSEGAGPVPPGMSGGPSGSPPGMPSEGAGPVPPGMSGGGSGSPTGPQIPTPGYPSGGGTSDGKKDYTFLTISPELRSVLKKAETIGDDSEDGVLYSSATDLYAAGQRGGTLDRSGLWRVRHMWDVTNVMEDRPEDHVKVMAVAIHKQKGSTKFRFENVLLCRSEKRAEQLQETLREKIAPAVAGFFRAALGHKVEVVESAKKTDPLTPPPYPGGPAGPGDGGEPMPGAGGQSSGLPGPGEGNPGYPGGGTETPTKPKEPEGSHITVDVEEYYTTFALNLWLGDRDAKIAKTRAGRLLFHSMRNQLAVGFEKDSRLGLGEALARMAKKGISRPDISPPEYFPPAAPKVAGMPLPVWNNPVGRVSWMAHLLPYLGHRDIHEGLNFYQSWKHPSNWLAARTVIPEFIDSTYPGHLQKVSYPGVPVDLGVTHIVGIAGVGSDAATYLNSEEDPRGVGKRGAFGYDRMTPLAAIEKNRGSLSNTAVMIQIPPDSHGGMTPWIAGGGSTVRTIPEKDSIKPFVQQRGDSRGAYVIMADGSVRFVKEGVSDSVFQAMCTVNGPTPEDFNVDSFSIPVVEKKRSVPADGGVPVKNVTGNVPPLNKTEPAVQPALENPPTRIQTAPKAKS